MSVSSAKLIQSRTIEFCKTINNWTSNRKSKAKIIYYANISIGIIQTFSSIFIFILFSLFSIEVISIDEISLGNTVLPHKTSEFIFYTILIFSGTLLLISGPFKLFLSRETKTLGI